MKTIEFKLTLTRSQEDRLMLWLAKMNWVHNSALACIESFNNHNRYNKADKRSYACNPIVSHWRGEKHPSCPVSHQLNQFNPESYSEALANPKDKKGTVYPLQAWAGEPLVNNLTYFSLLNRFAKKLHIGWLDDIPSHFISGRVERVALAWQGFLKGNAAPPKFKSRRNPVTSLINNNSKAIKVDGDRINIPLMGWVKAKGLSKRWPQGVPFCPMKIIKTADGWYLQLTGDVNSPKPVKSKGLVCGIDPGSKRHHTLDNGSFVEPPRYLVKSALKLRSLQRKLSRQIRMNSTQVFNKEGRCIRMIWAENWERKNFEKTKVKLAKLHQKIARQRKAFNHRLSTKYVRLFDEIALENTALTNMVRAVKKGEAGVPNGRKAKSGLNRNLLDNAIGQFYTMIEVKAKASHRIVTRVEPQYTSQTCNACGYRHAENRKSQSKFVCQHCGHSDNADTNAALNIKKMMQRGIQRLTFTDDMADGWSATTLPKTTKQPNPVEVVDPKPRKRSSHSKPAKPVKAKPDLGGCRKRVAEPVAQLDLFMV
jgi:putative transposase